MQIVEPPRDQTRTHTGLQVRSRHQTILLISDAVRLADCLRLRRIAQLERALVMRIPLSQSRGTLLAW